MLYYIRFVELQIQQLSKTLYSLMRILWGTRIISWPSNLAANDECLIFGNGPSLKDALNHHTEIRQGRDLFCVNYFALSEDYTQIRPSHYVLVDPFLWLNDIPQQDIQYREELFETLASDTDWPMILFIPHEIKKSSTWPQSKLLKNSNIVPVYFNRTPIDGFQFFRHFSYRYNIGIAPPLNVLIAAIFMSIKSGYKKVYVFGADHSWHEQIIVGSDNILYAKQEHFYDKKVSLAPFDKTIKGEIYKIHEVFEGWSRVFNCYHLLEIYAKSLGVNVFNATSKTYIDAFQRIKIDDISCLKG